MKKNLILNYLLFIGFIFLTSCGGDSDSGDGNGDNNPQVNSISILASQTNLDLGETVTFTVKTNTNIDVTANSTITIDGAPISGNSFTANLGGTYIAKAEYEEFTTSNLTITVVDNNIVSIVVMSDSSSAKMGDLVYFSVIGTNSSGQDSNITGASDIMVNGVANPDNKFLVTEMSDLNVSATFEALTASDIVVNVTEEPIPGDFTKKAIIEDYTGTWCGWCPRVSYGIELVEEQSDKVFAIAAHIGDNMENSFSQQLASVFNPGGSYPTAVLNRDVEWTYPEPSNVSQATNYAQGTISSGLSINSLMRGNDLKVFINTGFNQNLSGVKLVVFLLEDNIIASQSNYTSYYGGQDPITSFVHNHVLRYSLTNVLGDAIPAGELVANNTYSVTYDINVTSAGIQNSSYAGVMAMLVASDNTVINAQYSKVNIDKDFD